MIAASTVPTMTIARPYSRASRAGSAPGRRRAEAGGIAARCGSRRTPSSPRCRSRWRTRASWTAASASGQRRRPRPVQTRSRLPEDDQDDREVDQSFGRVADERSPATRCIRERLVFERHVEQERDEHVLQAANGEVLLLRKPQGQARPLPWVRTRGLRSRPPRAAGQRDSGRRARQGPSGLASGHRPCDRQGRWRSSRERLPVQTEEPGDDTPLVETAGAKRGPARLLAHERLDRRMRKYPGHTARQRSSARRRSSIARHRRPSPRSELPRRAPP